MPTSFTVASTADLNAAIQAIDLTGASSAPDTAYTISFSSNFTLTDQLYAINLASGDTLAIQGNGYALDGGGQYNGFFDYAGTVTISGLTISNAKAQGGAGGSTGGNSGGGGAGLGGGLFVAAGGAVTLSNVGFVSDSAVGGAAGRTDLRNSVGEGGGGGLNGGAGGSINAGSGTGGGGGIGFAATGGSEAAAAGAGIVLGAGGGGRGLNIASFGVISAGQGGASTAGGGGYGSLEGGGGGVGGGSVTEASNSAHGYIPGNGGFGGGGGGANTDAVRDGGDGGNGGFGGGGGSGLFIGGNGGFGGGGGGGVNFLNETGAGGFGGGGSSRGGGGGLGAGGAIFVQQGGSLTFAGGSVSGGSVAAGAGSSGGTNGSDFGAGLFLQGNQQVTLSATAAQPLAIGDVIADQTGSGGTGSNAGAGSLLVQGPGTVTLSGANTYTGGTTLSGGTLALGAATAAGTGAIAFSAGTAETLLVGNGFAPKNTLLGFGPGDTIDLAGVGLETTATLVGSTLTLSGGSGPSSTVSLQLDPGQSYAGTIFHLALDNQGGTDVTLVRASAVGGTTANQPTTDQNAISPFAGVTITDTNPGSSSETVTVTPSTTANGTLSDPNQATNHSHLGSDGVYVVSGTAAEVQAALRGLVFTPVQNEVAPGQTVTTTFTITDANTVAPSLISTDSNTSVVATSANDAPTITGLAASQSLTDKQTTTPFAGAVLTDPDVDQAETLTLTLTGGGGSIPTDAVGALSGAGLTKTAMGTYQLTGRSGSSGIAALQAALRAVVFTPTQNQVVPDQPFATGVSASLNDGLQSAGASASLAVTSAEDAPTITGLAASQATTDKATINPFSAVTVTDPDVGQAETVTLTLSSGGTPTDANGALSLSGQPGFTLAKVAGTSGVYRLTGGVSGAGIAALQAALRAVVFTPTQNQVAPGQMVTTGISARISDGPQSVDADTALATTSVSDPPAISGTKAASQATSDNATLTPFSGVSVTDPDPGARDGLTITLTNAQGQATDANGTLSGAGLTKSATPGIYTLAATGPAALTAALDALIFTPKTNQVAVDQTVTTTFALTATDDQGASTTDAKTSVVATSINDAPSVPQSLSYSVPEGQTLDLAQLLASAADPDPGDQVTITAISPSVLGTPTAGFLYPELGGGKLTYTADGYNPNAKQPVDSFSYTVTDNHGLSAQGTVNIAVTPSGSLANTQVGTAGADTLKATSPGTRLVGGAGNDTLTASVPSAVVFGGAGDDAITASAKGAVIYGGTGANTISLKAPNETVVLQQGGVDDISGFGLRNGDLLDLGQVLKESQLTGVSLTAASLGQYFGVASSGGDATLTFSPNGITSGSGAALATLHGVGPGVTLSTLVNDGVLRV